jgi:predicted transcriptional regulator
MDIEAYRNRRKKSVAELARMLGVKEAAIYNYKYGKSKPSYESIEKMLLDGAFISEIFNDEVQKKVVDSLGLMQESTPIKITNEDLSKAMILAAEILKKNKSDENL